MFRIATETGPLSLKENYDILRNKVVHMPRQAREKSSSGTYHIMIRGINRQNLFENEKYQRLGHLFQERFKSEAVETDAYFLIILRYIHQNPIKAAIMKNVEKYEWGSYHEHMSTPVITDIYYALDLYTTDWVLELFVKYSNEKNSDQCLEYEEKTSISDQELLEHLKRYSIVSISEIQKLGKEERNHIIKKMKKIEGATIRQLARITEILKSVNDRI